MTDQPDTRDRGAPEPLPDAIEDAILGIAKADVEDHKNGYYGRPVVAWERAQKALRAAIRSALSSARREANTLRRERDALMVELNRKADEARAFWGERDEARAALSAERAAREAAERERDEAREKFAKMVETRRNKPLRLR